MKKILCPVDFSKPSTKAAEYAVQLALRTKSALTLLHVLHLPMLDTTESAMAASQLLDEQRRHAADKLHSMALHLQTMSQISNLEIDYRVQEAFLADAIERLTREEKYDFVVMGTTGGGNTLEEILIGSNTESVMSQVKCPVLAIPADASFPEIHRIVYASDYQPEDAKALQQVISVAALFEAEVEVVHVSEEANEAASQKGRSFIEGLRAEVGQYPIQFKEIIHKDEATGLKDYLSTTHSNMLAILKKRRSFFKNLFGMSLAEKMTYQTKLPLLVLHADE